MTEFTLHTQETAPEASKPLLAEAQKTYGMIPGLYAVMAEAPSLFKAYRAVHDLFVQSSFNNDELTVVWQTINVENSCHYCVPAHTGIAKSMGVSDDISNALRDETPLADARLEALRNFTLSLVRDRGNVNESQRQAFLDAGFTHQQMLEVVLGYAQKIMSNYTNHLANTAVDKPFQEFEWHKAS